MTPADTVPGTRMTDAQRNFDLFIEPSAARHEEALGALVPIAKQLALRSGANGVTVADLREEAYKRGLVTRQNTHDRTKSFYGAVMKRAELMPINTWRRSHIDHSHGNLNRVWVDPRYRYDR